MTLRFLLSAAVVGLLAMRLFAQPVVAASAEVTVTRKEPSSTRQIFDPRRPSPKMPKLNPPESGVCDFDFTIDVGLSYSVGAARAGSVEIVIDKIDVITGLDVRIWTAQGSPPKLLAHEEGHRAICEYYYQNADFHARAAAEPVVGRTFIGRGANRRAAEADAVRQATAAVSDPYMNNTRVRCSAAQKRFDSLTRHGTTALSEEEAIRQIVQADPEIDRAVRLAEAAAAAAAAPTPAPVQEFWKWNDLVNRPNRWPTEARLARLVAFSDGTRFEKDTILRVVKVNTRSVEVILPDGSRAEFEPDETDLLTAANRYWGTLTEEQRAVDLNAVVRDRSLRPATVTTFVRLAFPSGAKSPGTEVPLADIVNNRLHIWSEADRRAMAVDPMETDFLARARELARLPADQRPPATGLAR